MEIMLSEFQDAFLSFFGRLGIGFSSFSGLENKLENETNFSEKNGFWEVDLGTQIVSVFGPSEDLKADT